MSDSGAVVKQKTLPELTRRVPIIEARLQQAIGGKRCGEGLLYTLDFSV